MARHSVVAVIATCLAAAVAPLEAAQPSPAVNKLLIKRDYKSAARALQAQANTGNANALYKLAVLYRLGLGVPRDESKARALLEKAAAAGSAKAAALLKRMGGAVPATPKAAPGGASAPVVATVNFDKLPPRNASQPGWLALAAARGDANAVKALLAAGARTDADAALGAVRGGKPEALKPLVGGKTTVETGTLLVQAAKAEQPAIVDVLLAQNADTSIRGTSGMTAADTAAATCSAPILAALAKAGAPASPHLSRAAALCANWKEMLSPYASSAIAQQDADGRSLAWYVAKAGNVEALQELGTMGADLGQPDSRGFAPAHMAALSGKPEALSLLVARQAPGAAAADGTTPLMLAAYAGCGACLTILLPVSGDVDAKTSSGETALMFAIAGGHAETVSMLLKAGANENARSESGDTPLKLAGRLKTPGISVGK